MESSDTLKTIGRAVEVGIKYKSLYELQLQTTSMYDSLYNTCKNKPPQVVEVVKKETNWIVTGIVSVAVLLLNWTIYLTLNK